MAKIATLILIVEYDADIQVSDALGHAQGLVERAQEMGRVAKASVNMHAPAFDLVEPRSWSQDALDSLTDEQKAAMKHFSQTAE